MHKGESTLDPKETHSDSLPPLVPGLPYLGNALQLGADPVRFAVNNYHAYGPIFRAKIPGREIYFLAGKEANDLAKKRDEEIFTNAEMFKQFREQIGPGLSSIEPDAHAHMRRLIRSAYTRNNVSDQIDTLTQVVDNFFDTLKVGDSFDVFSAMQRIVTTQLGCVLFDVPPGEYFPALRTYMKTITEVAIFRTRPQWVFRLPFYKNARKRSMEMADLVLQQLQSKKAGVDRKETSIDILLKNNDHKGNAYTHQHLISEALGPYLAGQDTVAGTLSFTFYTAHKYRNVTDRLSNEARDIFSPHMSAGDLRKLEDFHKLIKETMRLYPVGAFMPRHASKDFEFKGYLIPAGSAVYSATSVVHFLPENYGDPFTFDIDRPPGPGGSFVPYGVGNYACAGAGIADIQLMVTMAALMRRGRFELDPKDYQLKIATMPVPNPGRYKLKLVERY